VSKQKRLWCPKQQERHCESTVQSRRGKIWDVKQMDNQRSWCRNDVVELGRWVDEPSGGVHHWLKEWQEMWQNANQVSRCRSLAARGREIRHLWLRTNLDTDRHIATCDLTETSASMYISL